MAKGFRDRNVDLMQQSLSKLGDRLASGQIGLIDFGDAVRAEVRAGSAAAYRFALGRKLGEAETKELNQLLREQDGFLKGFIRDIVEAEDDLGFVSARAALYASAGLQADSLGATFDLDDGERVTWVGPDGGSSCEDCAPLIGRTWTRQEFRELGVVPGSTACKGHCRCSIRPVPAAVGRA